MKNQFPLRNATLGAALIALTATAWAASESLSSASDDSLATPQSRPVYSDLERTTVETVDVDKSLTPEETVIAPAAPAVAAPAPAAMPAPIQGASQPPITIEEHRLTEDERIQAVLMDRLATNPHLSGKIGVESRDSVVTLTGYTATAGQATRAGREARGVSGVRDVNNLIRARVGGSA